MHLERFPFIHVCQELRHCTLLYLYLFIQPPLPEKKHYIHIHTCNYTADAIVRYCSKNVLFVPRPCLNECVISYCSEMYFMLGNFYFILIKVDAVAYRQITSIILILV